jgi:predicted small secreted protein
MNTTLSIAQRFRSRHLGMFLMLALFACAGPVACNTIEGAGEDVSAAGDAIDETAEDAN